LNGVSANSMRTVRQRVLLHTAVQGSGRAVATVGGVLLLWLLTHGLSPADFGRYIVISGFVSVLYLATDLGIQAVAVREMARKPDQVQQIAGQLFALKLALSTAAFVFAIGFAWFDPARLFFGSAAHRSVGVAAIALFAVPFVNTAGAIYQTRLSMVIPAVAEVVSRCVSVIGVGLVLLGVSPLGSGRLPSVLAAITMGSLASAAIYAAGLLKTIRFRPVWNRSIAVPLVRDALVLGVVLVLSTIHYRVDVFVLRSMTNDVVVGRYGVGVKLLDIALGGASMFMGLVFPVLSSRSSGDRVVFQRSFQKSMEFLLVVGVAFAVSAMLAGPVFVQHFAPHQYPGAVVPFQIMAWAIPITFADMLFSFLVLTANRQLWALPLAVVTIGANVALNIALIPRLSAAAPAIVTVITEALSAVGLASIALRHYRFMPDFAMPLRILIAGAITALVGSVAAQHNQYVAITICALYPILLAVMGAITREDLQSVVFQRSERGKATEI